MPLNEQEIRNCIFRGGFCDLLEKLEANSDWRKVKGGKPEPRFIEREMILRFFAFAERINYYSGNLKGFLNDCMGRFAVYDAGQLIEMENMFKQTMQNIYAVFGSEHAARLYNRGGELTSDRNGKWDTKFSVSALDIQASAMIGQNPAKVQAVAEQLKEAYLLYLLSNRQVGEAITQRPAGASATRTRCLGYKAQVQEILGSTRLEPRFFSYEYRKSLFDTDPICKLCHNPIHSFEDCAVDHILPYSRGGKTEPINAQLAHRTCNAIKCANI
jgi:hypothetical protein